MKNCYGAKMISSGQSRAARALLNWTQDNLAAASGLSKTSINNFENAECEFRGASLRAIKNAFEAAGIQFISDHGVLRPHDNVQILQGTNALPTLWDHIFETLKLTGGEVLISNLNERRSHEAHKDELDAHLKRLKEHNISERLLCCDGDNYFIQPKECYRAVPREVYEAGMTTFIFADHVALQLWGESLILLIKSQSASNAERQRFEFMWDRAKPVV